MSKIIDYIPVISGTEGTNYKVSDDGLFFISGKSKIRPTRNCTVLYFVVGGGANGSDGTGASDVGRGGGGGAVQTGRVDLIANTTYIIHVKSIDATTGNAGNTVFAHENAIGQTQVVDITANGGTKNDSGKYGNSGTGGSSVGSSGSKLHLDASSPSSGNTFGLGGMSPSIGTSQAVPGNAINKNGQNGSIGGGGGGGYGKDGRGGNGGLGMVILLSVNNTNLVQNVEKQLREMNQLPGTMVDQYNQQYNATMMAGALWTVLATSLVFYVFTQV
jgi:hypothetical protein